MIMGFMFGLCGFTFLIVIIISKKHYENLYTKCIGKATGIFDKFITNDGMTCPVYKYVVKGKEFFCKCEKGVNLQNKDGLDEVIVYYNPSNPEESYIHKSAINLVLKIFGIVSIVFVILGVVFYMLSVKFGI